MEVLEHQPQWNQNILVQRLQSMATHEDGYAVAAAVEKFVTSSKWKVRRAAWRILGSVPDCAWQSFLQCMEYQEPGVRRDAITGLRFWVVPAEHEQEVCEVIAGSLEDSAVEVRMAAMEVMQDMNPGDEEVPRAAATSPASRDINGDDQERLL
ncbi:unnamed protein product [Cladocopium goreaui]|uniref:HEAT repeat domain-containing protein n=1 Tax=Cladocopium goreaui TaxID=2562237 RepID=A0A9P1BYG7_9DINO|nr:unnamed protein product [Cladocopium goreaui]